MARIVERDGRWYVTVKGLRGVTVSKSFGTYGRASAWMSRYENAKRRYEESTPPADPHKVTLGELLERYKREVTPKKRGAKQEGYRVDVLMRSSIAGVVVADITPSILVRYRNERSILASDSTVRGEFSIIRRTFETARREWGYEMLSNPAYLVTLPPQPQGRDRRLRDGEYEKLRNALAAHPLVWAFVRFAIETAMRKGEILELAWKDVFLRDGVIHIPRAKNGHARSVALTDAAVGILKSIKPDGPRVFNIDKGALRYAWVAACTSAGLKDLRIHDLRREGCSRLFELGLNVPEVASISGHRTASVLMRYTHPTAKAIREKLKGKKAPCAVE